MRGLGGVVVGTSRDSEVDMGLERLVEYVGVLDVGCNLGMTVAAITLAYWFLRSSSYVPVGSH